MPLFLEKDLNFAFRSECLEVLQLVSHCGVMEGGFSEISGKIVKTAVDGSDS